VISAVASALVAVAFVSLSRWGRHNVGELVPAHYSPERRAKDERSLQRGAKSCLAISILFALFSVVLAVGDLADRGWAGSP
jgi:hypothetical protein